jgi:hypothetical protein
MIDLGERSKMPSIRLEVMSRLLRLKCGEVSDAMQWNTKPTVKAVPVSAGFRSFLFLGLDLCNVPSLDKLGKDMKLFMSCNQCT